MNQYIIDVFKDLDNVYLPKDTQDIIKLKVDIVNGQRIYWYFEEDVEFAKENGYNIRDDAPYSGIVIARPNIECCGDMEIDETIVVMDRYPAEKCYSITDWVALGRLLDADGLVEIYSLT